MYPDLERMGDWNEHGNKIPLHLGSKINKTLLDCSLIETDIICHALHKAYLKIGCDSLTNILLDKLANINKKDASHNSSAIGNISKLLKTRGTSNDEEMRLIAKNLIEFLPDLHPMIQIRVVQMVISSNLQDYEPFIHQFATSIQDHLGQLRIRDLSKIANILFMANYTQDLRVYSKLCEALATSDRSDPRSNLSIIYTISILIKMKVLIIQDINFMFDQVNNSEALHSAITRKQIIEAAVDVIFNMSPGCVNKEMKKREKIRSSKLYLNGMRNLADLDWNIELDFQDYSGTRLNKDLRKKFLNIVHPDEDGINSLGERMRSDIHQDLTGLLGKDVQLKQLMPHYFARDVVFCLERRRNMKLVTASTLENEIGCTDMEIYPPDLFYGDWYVIVVPKRSHIDGHGNLFGPAMHKIRQLEGIGYKVIVVPYFAYGLSKETNTSRKYLSNLIRQR